MHQVRWTVPSVICAVGLGFIMACAGQYHLEWLRKITPVQSAPFKDMRIMLEGTDILARSNLAAFWGQVDANASHYNYPRVWATLTWVGVSIRQLAFWVMLAAVAWCGVAVVVASQLPPARRAWLSLPLFLSPASFLALERANTDLLIIGGVVLLLVAFNLRERTWAKIIVVAGFALLATFKFYPLFLLPLLWFGYGRSAITRLILSLAAVAALALLIPDMKEIATRTQQVAPAAYGVSVPKLYLVGPDTNYAAKIFSNPNDIRLAGLAAHAGGYLLALLLPIGAAWWLRMRPVPMMDSQHSDVAVSAWIAGALIYVGTFLLGANYDYRLIFLLLLLPNLLRQWSSIDRLLLWLIGLSFWLWYVPGESMIARLLALTAQWCLYTVLSAHLILSFVRSTYAKRLA